MTHDNDVEKSKVFLNALRNVIVVLSPPAQNLATEAVVLAIGNNGGLGGLPNRIRVEEKRAKGEIARGIYAPPYFLTAPMPWAFFMGVVNGETPADDSVGHGNLYAAMRELVNSAIGFIWLIDDNEILRIGVSAQLLQNIMEYHPVPPPPKPTAPNMAKAA